MAGGGDESYLRRDWTLGYWAGLDWTRTRQDQDRDRDDGEGKEQAARQIGSPFSRSVVTQSVRSDRPTGRLSGQKAYVCGMYVRTCRHASA